MPNRNRKTTSASQWGNNAFPPEAAENYDEFPVDAVIEFKRKQELALADEEWEVVDGLNFPYEQTA
ncbi:hypothetical protein [Thioclava sp. GXIMD2076]|uniref:hypothetical protein n=1 Tax=Thioclava sp. GXIMD2076 TaxID=3131931 RepID=UPI0030CB14BE